MGFFNNFNKNGLALGRNKSAAMRSISIPPLNTYHNILIVIEDFTDNKQLRDHLNLVFKNAKITTLTFRNTKIDESSGYSYTYNKSDKGFRKIKNNRLIGLINTNFDLLIDFESKPSELDYFVYNCNSSLKIGTYDSTKNYLYDLLLEGGNNFSDYISNIQSQINLLSNNGNN